MLLRVKSNTSVYIPVEHQEHFQKALKPYKYALDDGIWNIPNGIIGNISTDGLTVEIAPNINYLEFLDYFNLLLLNLFDSEKNNLDYSKKNHSNNIAESILVSFRDELIKVVKKGFPKKYELETKRSEFISGNVDFVESFFNIKLQETLPIVTNVEVLSYGYEEILEIDIAYKKFKKITKNSILPFDGISRHINSIKHDGRYLKHKNFKALERCYNLAYMINNNLNGVSKGKAKNISFLLNSNSVYEEFITSYIKKIFPNEDFQSKAEMVVASTEAITKSLKISPDLIYSNPITVILDMKNKNYYENLNSSDFHQMISYMSAFESKTAILLYPTAEDVIEDDIFNISYDSRIKIIKIGINIRELKPKALEEKLTRYINFD